MNATLRLLAPLALCLAALPSIAPALAASDTPERRETRAVSGFSGIRLAVPARLELTQGETESLVIEGSERALANIETVVEDGMLVIRTVKPSFNWTTRVRIHVGARRIESLAIAGAGDIRAASLRGPSIRISVGGAGDVRIGTLETDRADVQIGGSGNVRLAGRVGELSTRIAGSGDVRAGRLDARRVNVSIAGSGDVDVWARDSLAVKVTGSGDVRYFGQPSVEKTLLGSGSVKWAGAAPS